MKPIQNKIDQIPNSYLIAPGICEIPEWEVTKTLEWLEDKGVSLSSRPKTIEETFMQLSLQDLQKVAAGYREGIIKGPEVRLDQTYIHSPPAPTSLISFDETIAPKPTPPLPEDLVGAMKDSQPISDMDFEKLKCIEPFGRIAPSFPGTFLLHGELAFSVPDGYAETLHVPIYFPTKKNFELGSGPGDRTIEFPLKSRTSTTILPVPLGQIVRSVEQEGKAIAFAFPAKDDPLLFRARGQGPFRITVTDKNVQQQIVDFSEFRPSKEVQAYLRSLLYLPENLEKEMEAARTPEERLNLAASWLAAHDSKINLTNFRYACDRKISKFMLENRKHLPLIMGVLKVGHCDALTWQTVLLLRAYGVTAWRGTGFITVPDGTAMNRAYKHAVVILERSDQTCGVFDPTRVVELDPAYHPAVLPDRLVQEMSERFKVSKSDEERIAILQKFKDDLIPIREKAASHPKVLNDFHSLLGGGLSALFAAREADLGRARIEINVNPTSWDELPTHISPESFAMVAKSIDNIFPQYAHGEAGAVQNSKNPLWRKKVTLLLHASKETQCPALHAMTSNDYYDTPVYDAESHIKNHFQEDLPVIYDAKDRAFIWPPSSVRLKFSNSDELLKSIRYQDDKICQSYEILCEHISAWNLGGFWGRDNSSITNHRYSSTFQKIASQKEIRYLSSDHNEYTVYWSAFSPSSKAKTGETKVSEKAYLVLREDFKIFNFEYQLASLRPQYRSLLVQKLGLSTQTLRQLSLHQLDVDDGTVRQVAHHPSELKIFKSEEGERNIKATFEIFHVTPSCKTRFFAQLAGVIADLKFGPAPSINLEDHRAYVPGDDLRHFDWKVYGRSDASVVKRSPVKAKSEMKILHVLFEAHPQMKMITVLQHYEILAGLKKLSEPLGLTVYVGSTFGDSYFNLNSAPIKELMKYLLSKGKRERVGPWLPTGRYPKHLLYLSNNGMKMSAIRHLGFGDCKNLKTLHLDEELFLFPLANEKWVNEGFSDQV